jgi:activating signal cointegrator 1
MKAISLWQPWATLVAIGGKQYETRSWFSKYRGLLAIHAAKRMDQIQIEYCLQEPFRSVLKASGYKDHDMPLGAIIAVVKIVDVHKTEAIVKSLNKQEQAFGNYMTGRYAWKLEMVKRLEKPIPMKGSQGLFEVADDLIMRFM